MSDNNSEINKTIDAMMLRSGKKDTRKPKGVGVPISQTLAFRSYETRKINLQVLIDPEWVEQLKFRLDSQDDKVVKNALVAVEQQAEILGDFCFEALLAIIQGVHFDATVVIDVTGYEKP